MSDRDRDEPSADPKDTTPTGPEQPNTTDAPQEDESSAAAPEKVSIGAAVVGGIREAVDPFKSLLRTPRAMWGIYVSYTLEGLVYFGILTILGKYLSESVGMSDLHAGWVYSLFTGGITLAMLFMGGVADRIGVRRALLLSLAMMVAGRVFLGASGSFFAAGQGAMSGMFGMVVLGLFMVVLGYGMYQPAAYAGVKQFTDKKTATIGFAMIYGLMNLGAFFSGVLSPPVRHRFGMGGVYWVYAGLTLVGLLSLVLLLTKRVVARDTLTDISADKEGDDEESGSGDAEEAGANGSDPGAEGKGSEGRLWTGPFLVLVTVATTALVVLVFLAITSPRSAAQQAMDRVTDSFKKTARVLGAEKTDESAAKRACRDAARSIAKARSELHPPKTAPQGTETDARIFVLGRRWVKRQAELLRQVALRPTLTSKIQLSSKRAVALRNQIRALGVWHLAVAYALASKVDRSVVDRLRRRMKERDESTIALPRPVVDALLAAVKLSPGKLLAVTAKKTMEVARRVQGVSVAQGAAEVSSSQSGSAVVAAVLQADGAFLQDVSRSITEHRDPAVIALAKTTLLTSSIYYIRTLGPTFASSGGKPVSVNEGKVLSARLEVYRKLAASLATSADGAVHRPMRARLVAWGVRYGILAFVALLAIILGMILVLKKRPDHPFHNSRFVYFIFILIPVQTLFAHNWLTLPYYINRAFGGTWVGDNFEFFANINPILIFFLTPTVAALTARIRVYSMMVAGTFVMAVPTFLLALAPSPALLLVYILLVSIGEAMWQPRFLQWVAEIAPKGKEGAYMGIAQFPWFLTKVITGLYSGYFLSQYCPMVGPQNTQLMWFVYGVIAMASPVSLYLAKKWMMKGERLG